MNWLFCFSSTLFDGFYTFLKRILAILCLTILWIQVSQAQLTINSTSASDEYVAAASDYATEVLGNPWDMSDGYEDLANYIPSADYGSGLSSFSFSNGAMSFSILSADNAMFHLLSPGQSSTNPLGKNGQHFPIDSTKYKYLHIRMYTDTASEARIHWNTGTSYADNFVRTAVFQTRVGYHVYTIDLDSITRESNSNESRGWSEAGAITGLRFEPGYSGIVFIDWMRLTAAATSTYSVNHSFTAAGNDTMYSLFLDNDTNPLNGYVDVLASENTATAAVSIDPAPYEAQGYYLVGFASDDFATLVGNPWDMSDDADIHLSSGFTNESVASGVYSGRTDVSGASFSLNLNDAEITASKYRYLSVGVTFGAGAGAGRVRWYDTNGNLLNTANFTGVAGAQVLNIDLQSAGNWTGQIGELRIYPQNAAGIDFSIDFVSLRKNAYVASLTAPTIVSTAHNLFVNDVPQLSILQPDPRGGVDFAATVLGDPWNMDSLNDIKAARHVTDAYIYPNNYVNGKQGDFYCANSSDGSDDPYQVNLMETSSSLNQIDATRFKNVTWEYYVNSTQDVTNGSVARIIFKNEQRKNEFLNGDDTIIQLGEQPTAWSTYTQDMTKIQLEPLLHPSSSLPSPIWDGAMNYFRVDIHEFSVATSFCVNSVEVRADDEANTQFAIAYNVSDADTSDSNLKVSFYYNTSESTSGGTAIVEDLPLNNDSRIYLWDTSGISNGTYWVYGVVDDGYNTVSKIAHRISINHSRTQDSTDPILHISNPTSGDNVYKTLRLTGYAIDETQVALVEVLVDDSLLHVFQPGLFDKTARDTYPTYSDSSRAGFDEFISFTGITLGSHQVKVRVTDTGGNSTFETFTVNRLNGNDPGFSFPTEDEDLVSVPTSGDTNIKFKVSLGAKNGRITVKITNADRCSNVAVYAGTSQTDLENDYNTGTLISSVSPVSKRNLTGKVTKLKRYAGGKAYFSFVCDGSLHSTKSAQVNKIRGSKQISSFDKWLKKLKKLKLK